jgi:RsiW-degrading membrane proteinase PrsW (M82 family)
MTAAENKSKHMGLSIVIGIAIGTMAAILSSHVAVWLIAGIFVGIAAGATIGRKKCPECGAKGHLGTGYRAASLSDE